MFKNTVFIISFAIIATIVLIGVITPTGLDQVTLLLHEAIINSFGWAYLISAFLFLTLSLVLAFSRYGSIKLGKDDEKPEYSFFGWISMLFTAGMGIGLIFWGVAEPLSHFSASPPAAGTETGGIAAFSMRYSFFHWGLHPWAIYIVISLGVAYFTYRRGMPMLISSCFYPMLGERIYSYPGHIINILAIFATVFGVATSLGLGALQINSGLNYLFGIPDNITTTLLIIAVVTVLFIISSSTGLSRGIQILGKTNLVLATFLLIFIIIVGPTSYIFQVFANTIGEYLNHILEMSLQSYPYTADTWTNDWTIFYWAWWISWAPFVGTFIAQISRGRTIKEFILGCLLIPTTITFLWFAAFGGTGLYFEIQEGQNLAAAAAASPEVALFQMFELLPLGAILSGLTVVLLMIFFITSADSATYVLGSFSSGGSLYPTLNKRITWGLAEASVASILLFSGGLLALQRAAIAAALPFTAIMLLMCYNIYRALREEK